MDYAGIELISVIFLSIRALLCPTESPLLAIQTFVSPYIPTRSWAVGSLSDHKVLIVIYIYLAVIINHAARKTDVRQAGNACRLEGFDVFSAVICSAGAD